MFRICFEPIFQMKVLKKCKNQNWDQKCLNENILKECAGIQLKSDTSEIFHPNGLNGFKNLKKSFNSSALICGYLAAKVKHK